MQEVFPVYASEFVAASSLLSLLFNVGGKQQARRCGEVDGCGSGCSVYNTCSYTASTCTMSGGSYSKVQKYLVCTDQFLYFLKMSQIHQRTNLGM